MFELMVDNRNGTLWTLTQLVPDMSWRTSRVGKASTLEFTVIRNPLYQQPFTLECGDVVRVSFDGQPLFFGYIFAVEESEERELKVTAYDQIRYLLEEDTYVKENVTAEQVIRDNAQALSLVVGELADTKHVIPAFVQDGQKRLDMICKALDETLLATGRLYVFYDDAGRLTLRDVADMKIDVLLGDGSLVYGYSLKRDIDSETFNRIKLVKDNKETGRREAYLAQDSERMTRWGRLQYYQQVNDNLNEEQIKAMADRLLQLRNREQRSFSLEVLGYPGVRAGVQLQVTIGELGINQFFLVEECTHHFKGDEHTMSLEMKVIDIEFE